MTPGIQRTLRIINLAAGERPQRPRDYWCTRTPSERLSAALALHREGNAEFLGGHPAFVYAMEVRRAHDQR